MGPNNPIRFIRYKQLEKNCSILIFNELANEFGTVVVHRVIKDISYNAKQYRSSIRLVGGGKEVKFCAEIARNW